MQALSRRLHLPSRRLRLPSEAAPTADVHPRCGDMWYQAQLAKPVPWDGRPIDPGKEVLLVRGVAVKRLGEHQELGVQTSHDLLRLMQKQYTAHGGKEDKDEEGKPGTSVQAWYKRVHLQDTHLCFVVSFPQSPVARSFIC